MIEVILRHECARLLERAFHRAQVGEPAQRRGPRVLARRVVENLQDCPLGLLDRQHPSPEDDAQPSRRRALERPLARGAGMLDPERETPFTGSWTVTSR